MQKAQGVECNIRLTKEYKLPTTAYSSGSRYLAVISFETQPVTIAIRPVSQITFGLVNRVVFLHR